MEASYRFFENRSCQYFPCHRGLTDFNCLFCYCPFYMKEKCPGHPAFLDFGDEIIKDCTNCTFPHRPENYDRIMALLREENRKRTFSGEIREQARRVYHRRNHEK